jgi:putative FmdB family regulatory protein
MPTYEFRCPKGHEFNRFYKTMSTALTELPCPECNAVATRQLSAGAGLVFKGSGFYLTDYGKNAHRADGGTRTADGAKSESGGESKPTADSTPKTDTSTPKAEAAKPAESREPKAESSKKAESPKPKKETAKPKSK